MDGNKYAKGLGYVAIATLAILAIPLIAMQFTSQVVWTPLDFIIMGSLLFGTGAIYVVGSSKIKSPRNRMAFGILVFIALVLIWAELAVGIFGTPFAGS